MNYQSAFGMKRTFQKLKASAHRKG